MHVDRLGGTVRRRPSGERAHALLLAAIVVLAVALVAGGIVLAKVIRGAPGGQTINGTPGPDRLAGGGGNDRINGLEGRDRLRGGRGNDTLVGGPGRDVIVGGRGRDALNMRRGVQLDGVGNDVIRARDHGPDEVNCGAGDDVAYVDRAEDGVFDCERVIAPR